MTIYTHTGLSAPDNTSAATLRKWASLVDAMILACGWVQTADTGQSDPATATVPGVNNTAAGKRIYSLNDTLAGVAPVYLAFEWGRGGGTTAPSSWFTIGRGSDGAGILSGLLLARSQTTSSGTINASEVASWASGDGSSLNLTMWPTHPTLMGWTLRVERSRTLAGEPTAEGVAITLASQSTSIVRTIAYTGTIDAAGDARATAQSAGLPGVINGSMNLKGSPGSISQDGVTAPVFPVVFAAPGVTPWVSANIAALAGGDAGLSSLITVNTHGVDKTFRTFPLLGSSAAGCDVTVAGSSSTVAITAQVWAD